MSQHANRRGHRSAGFVERTGYAAEQPPAIVHRTGYAVAQPPAIVHRTGYAVAQPPAIVHHTGYAVAQPPAIVHRTGYAVAQPRAVVERTGHTAEQPRTKAERGGRRGNWARRTGTPNGNASRDTAYDDMPPLVPIDGVAHGNGSVTHQKKPPQAPTRPTGIQTTSFRREYDIQIATSGRFEDEYLHVVHTNSPLSAQAFVRDYLYLCDCEEVGFDLEHRPTYRPGQKPNVSLLQFAPVIPDYGQTPRTFRPVLVYSIYHDSGKIPDCLQEILADPSIKKYGVGIKGDLKHLAFLDLPQDSKAAYKELAPLAHKVGLADRPGVGLKALVERCLGVECTAYKTKKLTMTNWEKDDFSEAEIKYAAMDAWTAVECLSLIKYVASTDPDRSHPI